MTQMGTPGNSLDSPQIQHPPGSRSRAAAATHAAHVRVAWWYLRQGAFPDALARFSGALRRFAARHGAARKYHETIAVAWMAVIAERRHATPELDWGAFAAAHPDLLVRAPSILDRYDTRTLLQSDAGEVRAGAPKGGSSGHADPTRAALRHAGSRPRLTTVPFRTQPSRHTHSVAGGSQEPCRSTQRTDSNDRSVRASRTTRSRDHEVRWPKGVHAPVP